MPQRRSLTQNQIDNIPQSDWYRYTLECTHNVFSKVRIIVPKDYSYMENMIMCPQCNSVNPKPITEMHPVNTQHVNQFTSAKLFVAPTRIYRTMNGSPVGSPRPYTTSSRDYD